MTLVDDILARIIPSGEDAALPAEDLAAFAAELEQRKAEGDLFVALAYFSVQLSDAGLARAAQQLLVLARIGLRDANLEHAVEEAQSRSSAAKPSGLAWRRTAFKPD